MGGEAWTGIVGLAGIVAAASLGLYQARTARALQIADHAHKEQTDFRDERKEASARFLSAAITCIGQLISEGLDHPAVAAVSEALTRVDLVASRSVSEAAHLFHAAILKVPLDKSAGDRSESFRLAGNAREAFVRCVRADLGIADE